MRYDDPIGGPLPTRARPLFNLLSIVLPVVGAVGCVVFLTMSSPNYYSPEMAGTAYAFIGCCLVGLALAVIAAIRVERFWGLTVLGFLLNAPVVLLVVWTAVTNLSSWVHSF